MPVCQDAAEWLESARDDDAGTEWIRRNLDLETGEVVIPCVVCGDESRFPVWTMGTPALRERLDTRRLRRCEAHQETST